MHVEDTRVYVSLKEPNRYPHVLQAHLLFAYADAETRGITMSDYFGQSIREIVMQR
jgi:hypothetical protein